VLLKCVVEPGDIAAAVLYLCSSASSFVVGAEIVIDGGMTLEIHRVQPVLPPLVMRTGPPRIEGRS
jgi:enoyl-[acyl-carrier-protein] reductase (NADH)